MSAGQTPVAVIAGAGAGGAATASALGEAGYHIVVLDSRPEPAQAVADQVTAEGGSAEAHAIDLLDTAAVTDLRDDLAERLGRIDVLVHLVGGWRGSSTLDLASVENWNALHPPIVGTLAVLTAVFGTDVSVSPVGRVFMVVVLD